MNEDNEASRVREHYDSSIGEYDRLHGGDHNREHLVAIDRIWSYVRPHVEVQSILDVGCGTGRTLAILQERDPSLKLAGIDPSAEMCRLATDRVEGAEFKVADGASLPYQDGSFDLVMASGIMHHIGDPKAVIRELFRVAKCAVVVSDHNDFAMGSEFSRRFRLMLYAVGLFSSFNFLKQGFKKQRHSDVDGRYYPYSVLNNYDVFSSLSKEVMVCPTRIRGAARTECLMLRQTHFSILCLK